MKHTILILAAVLCLALAACDDLGTTPKPSSSQADLRSSKQEIHAIANGEEKLPPDWPRYFPVKPGSPQEAELKRIFEREHWAKYTVKVYEALRPEYADSQRRELWYQYRMTLEDPTHAVRLLITCGQSSFDPNSDCGQGALLPNDKVWTRAGYSGECLFVYPSRKPLNGGLAATFWLIHRQEAMRP